MTQTLITVLSVIGGLAALGLLARKAGKNCTP
jgi:hypothetical protein